MIAGLSRTAAAQQPRRSSGKATNVATMQPAVPITSHNVTIQSPASGRNTAAVNHGTNAYGNASAFPCPTTGMRNGMVWLCHSRWLTYHTWA